VESRWTEHYLWTSDNVRLHYRDFAGGREGQPALLCLPGLTRNARDFQALAERFAPRFRVITPSFRGRGDSGYARDPLSYVPLTYLQDLGRLLDDAGLSSLIIIGTSLGGLMGLLLDGTQRSRIAGLVLNDLGPTMEEAGLARVRTQVGKGGNWPTWLTAARDIARRQADIYPGWKLEQWLARAKGGSSGIMIPRSRPLSVFPTPSRSWICGRRSRATGGDPSCRFGGNGPTC
jgi:pimeloyl-ACP methyl ester carboxylesterase